MENLTFSAQIEIGMVLSLFCGSVLIVLVTLYIHRALDYYFGDPELHTPVCFGRYPFLSPSELTERFCATCPQRSRCITLTSQIDKDLE